MIYTYSALLLDSSIIPSFINLNSVTGMMTVWTSNYLDIKSYTIVITGTESDLSYKTS